MSTVALKITTNLAEYPVTQAIRDGRVSSNVVALDCCGPKLAHDAFRRCCETTPTKRASSRS